ncbi:MAG TPA: helix-turn-helix transcriptional regulator [Candidatus Polarisedimenticolia bacterium]|nr:helix-turn-helix transcriptional regulator [Candidatus Polarisedimenticolia bacterium]
MGSSRAKYRQPLLVGDRIRTLRKDRNLTQAELAASIGIQQSDLCRMENGEYKVSLESLFKILSIFQINIAEFFHEEAPPSISDKDVDFLREFQKLDAEAQREVWDFMRFKRFEEGGGAPDLDLPTGFRQERDHKKE